MFVLVTFKIFPVVSFSLTHFSLILLIGNSRRITATLFINDTRSGSLTSPQRCNRCIFSPKWLGLIPVGEDLPLNRDVIGVFYSLSQLGQTLVREFLLLCKDIIDVFYSYSLLVQTLVGEVLALCRDIIGVFYSPSQQGLTLIGEVLPLCRDSIGVFYSPTRLSNSFLRYTR